MRDIFAQEKAELTWQELTANTIRQRGSAHPILHRSGMLEESFQKGQPAHYGEITPKKLTWGSAVPYALFHQTGTGKGFGKDRVTTGPGTGAGCRAARNSFSAAHEAADGKRHDRSHAPGGAHGRIRRHGRPWPRPADGADDWPEDSRRARLRTVN